MKILITGANGMLGNVVVENLAKQHQVFALVRKLPSLPIPSVQYLIHDLNLPTTDLLPHIDNLDAIVHTAQSKLYKDFPNSASDIFAINVQATLNLLELGRHFKIKNFLFTSTGTVYEPFQKILSEDTPVDPKSFYGVSKYLSEKILTCYTEFFNICTFRLFFLYKDLNTSSLISTITHRIKSNQPIMIEGKEGLSFTPTHVRDVANLIHIALNKNWTGTLNVAAPEAITLMELVKKLSKELAIEPILNKNEKEAAKIIPNLTKLRTFYPEMNFTSIDQGIRELLCVIPAQAGTHQ